MLEYLSNARRPMSLLGFSSGMAAYRPPTSAPTPESVAFQDGAVRKDSGRPLRVVIVEDEAIIAMELEMLLEDLGMEVVGKAMSAAEAEALVSAEQPDFLTMDIHIKGNRDGVEAACTIFQRYGIRAIFVSAFSDAEIRERAIPAKPFGWIRKPVDPADLANAVKHMDRSKT